MVRIWATWNALNHGAGRQALMFGAACALMGASAASLAWVSFNERQQIQQIISGAGVNSNDGIVGQVVLDAGEMALSSVPLHQRKEYTVEPPDILKVEVRCASPFSQDQELQDIGGEKLVAPDGTITLGGNYGSVAVAGRTLDEIRTAIAKRIDADEQNRRVDVSVVAQNSHVYYVILEGNQSGDQVHRYPANGDDTLLDALSQVGRFNELRTRRIWIARPVPGGTDEILPVQWTWTSDQTATGKNYQILAGDRIFITQLPTWMDLIEQAVALQSRRKNAATNTFPVKQATFESTRSY